MIDLSVCSVEEFLTNRRTLLNELRGARGLQELRIAVLGGATTFELVNFLELLLLSRGFKPVFYQSEFGRYYEDAVQDAAPLIAFKPDLVYIYTSYRDLNQKPAYNADESQFTECVQATLAHFTQVWDSLNENLGCLIVQNNFEASPVALFGNLDAVHAGGESRFLLSVNNALASEVAARPKVALLDAHGLSARFGLSQWFDWRRYWSYKLLLTPEATFELARSLASLVAAIYGKSRKVLVLDLDNTLWGGVIGDDGVDNIQIGRETPVAEAYTEFQEYCLRLRERGIVLAVCSKNSIETAKAGFKHPSSVLKLEDFSSFKANWNSKPENLIEIAEELNLGIDSFVFVDDNAAERALVNAQLPQIAVPELGDDVATYIDILERGRYFEAFRVSHEDFARADAYASNTRRHAAQKKFANYGEYLDSLEMIAEIQSFRPPYLERIAQLTNKTNQFNLTTRRYTLAEMEALAADEKYVTLYGKLNDRYGDNGLVSVIVGRKEGQQLHLDLWLMSCRVIKRDMEIAMLDRLVEFARKAGVEKLLGCYIPTAKNGMVAELYPDLGFAPSANSQNGSTFWELDIRQYIKMNKHIRILEVTGGAANS